MIKVKGHKRSLQAKLMIMITERTRRRILETTMTKSLKPYHQLNIRMKSIDMNRDNRRRVAYCRNKSNLYKHQCSPEMITTMSKAWVALITKKTMT